MLKISDWMHDQPTLNQSKIARERPFRGEQQEKNWWNQKLYQATIEREADCGLAAKPTKWKGKNIQARSLGIWEVQWNAQQKSFLAQLKIRQASKRNQREKQSIGIAYHAKLNHS